MASESIPDFIFTTLKCEAICVVIGSASRQLKVIVGRFQSLIVNGVIKSERFSKE